MGQRLVFECKRGGETFATLYFHWSAYTGETYSVAGTIFVRRQDSGNKEG